MSSIPPSPSKASALTTSDTHQDEANAPLASIATMDPPNLGWVYRLRQWVAQQVVASFLAGGVAGAISRTVVSPLERLKILLQVQSGGSGEYQGTWNALKKIWREEGFKGMMAGNGTNCARIVPYSAVQFGSYNFYKPLVSLWAAMWFHSPQQAQSV